MLLLFIFNKLRAYLVEDLEGIKLAYKTKHIGIFRFLLELCRNGIKLPISIVAIIGSIYIYSL